MKHILWISRHPMTPSQVQDLQRIVGEPYQLEQWDKTVETLDELSSAIDRADWIAAVLPIALLAALVQRAGNTPIIQARSKRQATGTVRIRPDGVEESEYRFVHNGWEQILKLELEMVPLSF